MDDICLFPDDLDASVQQLRVTTQRVTTRAQENVNVKTGEITGVSAVTDPLKR